MSESAGSSSQRWLVTGAAGYLGSYVTEQLIARGQRVIAVDDLSGGRIEYLQRLSARGYVLEQIDIRNVDALAACFQRHRPAAVIHLAALHFIPAAMADPPRAVSLNVHGTQSVLHAARLAEVQTVWFASTGDVYAPDETAHAEDSPLAPFNIYGLTKLMGEQLVALESRLRPSAKFVVGRLFNLYGPRETNPHFLPELLSQIRADRSGRLRLGNLFPRRDLVPVADAARAVIESAQKVPAGLTTLNIASGVAWPMSEVVQMLNELLGGSLHVETDTARVRPVERAHLQADVCRLRELIGWAPHPDLHRGLQELLAAEGIL